VTRNSIFANGATTGQIRIDLLYGTQLSGVPLPDDEKLGTAPFISLNDVTDLDTGGNDVVNAPVLEDVHLVSGQLELSGYALPGSSIELFVADPDPSGFGEGKSYLMTLVEGAPGDLDATTATYGPGPINTVSQGTDTTSRFRFRFPPPPAVTFGTKLTATATLAGETSEFSGVLAVALIGGTVVEDVNGDGDPADAAPAAGVAVRIWRDGGDGLPTGADDPAHRDDRCGRASTRGTTGRGSTGSRSTPTPSHRPRGSTAGTRFATCGPSRLAGPKEHAVPTVQGGPRS
jgi:hypothetical protein